jgi:hypothetical protein
MILGRFIRWARSLFARRGAPVVIRATVPDAPDPGPVRRRRHPGPRRAAGSKLIKEAYKQRLGVPNP